MTCRLAVCGYAPQLLLRGTQCANSMFRDADNRRQIGVATAVLIHSVSAASGISFKALIYDGSHSVDSGDEFGRHVLGAG